MERIYLDHGATTPMHPLVIEKMTEIMATVFGNPSSIHQQGRQAHGLLEEARSKIANSLNANDHEIIFTSGGTESDNSAIMQTAHARVAEGKHIITSAVEHPAVLNTMKELVHQGFEVTYLPVNEAGGLTAESVAEVLREDTILVSLMSLNNETGVRFPIAEIGQLLAGHSAYFHTDAVQAFGLDELDVKALGVDFLSATAHKINGPKGIGFLYIRDGISLPALLHGGEQEEKRRPGTENLAGIQGFATAVEILTPVEKAKRLAAYEHFGLLIKEALTEAEIPFVINGGQGEKSPHILNLWLKGIPNDLLLMHLDLQGISLSIGSACTAGNVEPSHVLEAMYGKGHPSTKESLRVSFGLGNTVAEIELFIERLLEVVHRLGK
ncbi:cysteine desulfurase [Vagococcus sp. BWB3-3]|uniref:cysteine desulfurase n=1 Tax=Vagococcus allomyrinae TaxID=2794353 RepID=A0A940P107_9ENTE|nr:cysteine desulfurase family protein [Vagococcus allomyrinae]MBP1039487.1 cysteine desulfurase [Vagococcus allomyrinae]